MRGCCTRGHHAARKSSMMIHQTHHNAYRYFYGTPIVFSKEKHIFAAENVT
jgi:hypothetical protein